MNRFFTLLLAASCLTALGQVQGDFNDDGFLSAPESKPKAPPEKLTLYWSIKIDR